MAAEPHFDVITTDLEFPEEPVWRDGALWFVDSTAGRLHCLRPEAGTLTDLEVGTPCSGFGWLPDGRIVVVATERAELLVIDEHGVVTRHADLRDHVAHRANGASVSSSGRVYVGSAGFDPESAGGASASGGIAIVESDCTVSWAVPDGLWFPNGVTLTADEDSLLVAETYAARVSAFSVLADGSLGNRRTWANLPDGTYPDGICLDSEGALWIADAAGKRVLRVAPGGEVLQLIEVPRRVFACAIGGAHGHTLYLMTAKSHRRALRAARTGMVLATEVGSTA